MAIEVTVEPFQKHRITVEEDGKVLASATHDPSPTHSDPGTWQVYGSGVSTFTIHPAIPNYAMERLLLQLVEGAKVVEARERAESKALAEAALHPTRRKRTTPVRGKRKES